MTNHKFLKTPYSRQFRGANGPVLASSHFRSINFHKYSSFVLKPLRIRKGRNKFHLLINTLIKRDSLIYGRTFIQIKCIENFFLSACPKNAARPLFHHHMFFFVKMETNMYMKLIIIWVFANTERAKWKNKRRMHSFRNKFQFGKEDVDWALLGFVAEGYLHTSHTCTKSEFDCTACR